MKKVVGYVIVLVGKDPNYSLDRTKDNAIRYRTQFSYPLNEFGGRRHDYSSKFKDAHLHPYMMRPWAKEKDTPNLYILDVIIDECYQPEYHI